jgi:hypothetical protein
MNAIKQGSQGDFKTKAMKGMVSVPLSLTQTPTTTFLEILTQHFYSFL